MSDPVIDRTMAVRIATQLGWEPKRKWVGLTDKEIEQAAQGGDTNFWDFCRIIEAKLKEKNT